MKTSQQTSQEGKPGQEGKTRKVPTESVVIGVLAIVGLVWNHTPISDNSTFVHLRTGIDMVRSGSIPRVDPYSFTAHGQPWILQSWLAEWTYGLMYQLGGDARLVVAEMAVLTGLLAWVLALLVRTGSSIRTAAGGIIVIDIGIQEWSQRPLLFGLLALALTILVTERRWSPWWLLPVAWVWVNTHGSFPLGVLWFLAVLAGTYLDERRIDTVVARYGMFFVGGVLLGGINPIGPRVLLFLTTLSSRKKAFANIVEWKSADYRSIGGMLLLAGLLLAIMVLARTKRNWRDLVPALVFLALALHTQRNIPVVGVVLAPVLGRSLRTKGEPTASHVSRMFWAPIVLMVVLTSAMIVAKNPIDEKPYPKDGVDWLAKNGWLTPQHHVAAADFVGCYRILRYGKSANVFIDDRYDMYPPSVSADEATLHYLTKSPADVFGHWNIDAVLWERSQPLASWLKVSPQWREAWSDKRWEVFTRT